VPKIIINNTTINLFFLTAISLLVISNGSTSVERRQWSAVSGAPSIKRELIERCVGRAPSVER